MTLIDDPKGWFRRRFGLRYPSLDTLGFKLSGVLVMEQGLFEPTETTMILRLLDTVEVLVNVGANIGYYCCHAMARGKRTVAVEPFPRNFRILRANAAANGWSGLLEAHPVALAAREGVMRLYGGGTAASLVPGWAGQRFGRKVRVSTLDGILGDRFANSPVLVVIDVEGAELGVLEGAARTLAAPVRPIWFVEIAVNEHQPRGLTINPNLVATFDLMDRAGYHAYSVAAEPRRVTPGEARRIAETGTDTFETHNFLFVSPERAAALELPG